MRRLLARVLLAVFAAGQLQLIPATMACTREHSRPAMGSHCDGVRQTDAAAVRAAPTTSSCATCPFLGPCSAQAPAAAGVTATVSAVAVVTGHARSTTALLPDSFDSSPPAPPPEA